MMCVRVIMMVATATAQSHLDNLKTYSDHSPPPGWTQNTLTMFDVQYQEHWGGMGTCWFT